MGWYPPLNELSDSTWHMFTHVLESNQHSLHDIYVHGGLYPTHACTRCKLILMHVHDCCRSLSWSLPSLLLAFTVLSGNTACASKLLKPQSCSI